MGVSQIPEGPFWAVFGENFWWVKWGVFPPIRGIPFWEGVLGEEVYIRQIVDFPKDFNTLPNGMGFAVKSF